MLVKDKLFYLCIIPVLFAWLLVNVYILTQGPSATADDLSQIRQQDLPPAEVETQNPRILFDLQLLPVPGEPASSDKERT